jgi:hypothetical protein
MAWTTERSTMFSSLWDVYDDDGNVLAKDKTIDNARLIAAAPELLEALKDAYKAIESLDIGAFGTAYASGTGEPYPIRDELLHNIAKAIAKAEGDA